VRAHLAGSGGLCVACTYNEHTPSINILSLYIIYIEREKLFTFTIPSKQECFLQAFYSRFLEQGSKSLIHIESRSLKVLITCSMKR
jgi:hypothetical protein